VLSGEGAPQVSSCTMATESSHRAVLRSPFEAEEG
jgi:hypothetical protein